MGILKKGRKDNILILLYKGLKGKASQFSQTIRDLNDIPESLISSSELSDDSVFTFTSLMRVSD